MPDQRQFRTSGNDSDFFIRSSIECIKNNVDGIAANIATAKGGKFRSTQCMRQFVAYRAPGNLVSIQPMHRVSSLSSHMKKYPLIGIAVDHTVTPHVVDRDGRLVAVLDLGPPTDKIISTVRKLL